MKSGLAQIIGFTWLKLDNSVTSLPIDKQGNVFVAGKNLFDPSNPIWDGKPPVIVWPDL